MEQRQRLQILFTVRGVTCPCFLVALLEFAFFLILMSILHVSGPILGKLIITGSGLPYLGAASDCPCKCGETAADIRS